MHQSISRTFLLNLNSSSPGDSGQPSYDQSALHDAPAMRTAALILLLSLITAINSVSAAEYHIYPGKSFKQSAEKLKAGDTLIVHEGTYIDEGRIAISVRGHKDKPVIIMGAPNEEKPLITRKPKSSIQNTINIEGASHLSIRHLEISSNGGDGIRLRGNSEYITLKDLTIHDIAVGINLRSSMHHIVVSNNHIFNTEETGEGLYIGCNRNACSVSESVFENNWIHDTRSARQGDGIEIKAGSHSNIVRNNVIHDTKYPCILVYGTSGKPRNRIDSNLMWNCGDSGIQAAADAVISNNVILNSPESGFNSHPHQGITPQNLTFVHNTIIGGDPCLRLRDWANKPGMIFSNNAIYCESGHFKIPSLEGVNASGNVFAPAIRAFPAQSYETGGSIEQDFTNADLKLVYPSEKSTLLGAGKQEYATKCDFTGFKRETRIDAGAYQYSDTKRPQYPLIQQPQNTNCEQEKPNNQTLD